MLGHLLTGILILICIVGLLMPRQKNENVELYKKCRYVSQSKAYIAFSVPTKRTERIRGFLGLIAPYIVAKLMLWRSNRTKSK